MSLWDHEQAILQLNPVQPTTNNPLERIPDFKYNNAGPSSESPRGDMNMYTTSDLYLTGYLIARGSRLDSFERNDGKTTFRLMDKDGLDEIIREYYADRGMVSGLKLNNALKNLKNLLHSNMDYYGNHKHINNTGTTR